MRRTLFLLALAACDTGKIQITSDDSDDSDVTTETDPGEDTDGGGGTDGGGTDGGGTDDVGETDQGGGGGDASHRDDDGDCTCEVAPCSGSSNPSCTDLGGDDCNDTNPAVSPRVTETCNGVDDDCVDGIDNGVGTVWYPDGDADGFGASAGSIVRCDAVQPSGFVANSRDCYDQNGQAKPGLNRNLYFETDRGDGSFDYDCNGQETKLWDGPYTCSAGCMGWGVSTDGWLGATPACGVMGELGAGCEAIDAAPSCQADTVVTRPQVCR